MLCWPMNGQSTNKQKEAVTFLSRSVHTTTTLINYLLHGHQLRNENDCCTRCAAVFLNKRTKHDSSSSQTEDLAANTGNISHAHTHTHTRHCVCSVGRSVRVCLCVWREPRGEIIKCDHDRCTYSTFVCSQQRYLLVTWTTIYQWPTSDLYWNDCKSDRDWISK